MFGILLILFILSDYYFRSDFILKEALECYGNCVLVSPEIRKMVGVIGMDIPTVNVINP